MRDDQDSRWEKIAGKLHGELTHQEETLLNQELSDPKYARDFKKAQLIERQLSDIEFVNPEHRKKSWDKIESGIGNLKRNWIMVILKYAAVITVAFIAGNLLNLHTPAKEENRFSEIRSPHGQMSKITLPDGTKIWLNSGTTIRYPDRFTDENRTVTLSGEAYFEVAKTDHKPFTVYTADMQVEVFGTSFNVSAYRDDETTAVTLVEGIVEARSLDGKTVAQLIPGQLASKNKKGSAITIQNVQTSFYKAWIEGKLYFDDQPLYQIATKLERWFNVEVEFANDQLKSYKFTGTILKNKPLDQIMQALELLAPIKFKHQINTTGKDKITIYKRT